MEKKRSKGVTTLAWIHIFSGVYILIYSVKISMQLSRVVAAEGYDTVPLISLFLMLCLIVISVVISVFLFILGNGLLKLKEQARKWAIYLAIFSLIVVVATLYFTKGSGMGGLLLPIITFRLFSHPKVKAQFNPELDEGRLKGAADKIL